MFVVLCSKFGPRWLLAEPGCVSEPGWQAPAEMLRAAKRRAEMLTSYSSGYGTGDVGYHRKDRDV